MKKTMMLTISLLLAATAGMAQTVRCESDGHYKECGTNGLGRVTLARQLSNSECIQGQTWGMNTKGRVWVDKGCRAEFAADDGRYANNAGNDNRRRYTQTVLCESSDGHRHQCLADTSYGVELARQLSKNGCVFNRDWGYDRNSVWVANGCRAEFSVGSGRSWQNNQQAMATSSVRCESPNNKRQQCRAETRYGVQVGRQLSDTACIRGKNWDYDRDGIWVWGGCRADFNVAVDSNAPNGMISSSRATTLLCEANGNGKHYCAADTSYGVSLSRQISSANCVRGQTWGYDTHGVWVSAGCRAEFLLGDSR
jgi:hypothetical protein